MQELAHVGRRGLVEFRLVDQRLQLHVLARLCRTHVLPPEGHRATKLGEGGACCALWRRNEGTLRLHVWAEGDQGRTLKPGNSSMIDPPARPLRSLCSHAAAATDATATRARERYASPAAPASATTSHAIVVAWRALGVGSSAASYTSDCNECAPIVMAPTLSPLRASTSVYVTAELPRLITTTVTRRAPSGVAAATNATASTAGVSPYVRHCCGARAGRIDAERGRNGAGAIRNVGWRRKPGTAMHWQPGAKLTRNGPPRGATSH